MHKIDRRDMLKGAATAMVLGAMPGGRDASAAERPSESTASACDYFDKNFGVSRELLRKTLARASATGGTYAEVYLQYKISESFRFEDGQVIGAQASVDLGAGIRVVCGDQTGYAFSEDLSPQSLLAAADTAASIARSDSRWDPRDFTTVKIPQVYPREIVWVEVKPERKIAIAQTMGEKIMSGDPSVISASVRLSIDDEVILVANTLGEIVEDIRPMLSISGQAVAEKDGRRESDSYRDSARRGIDYLTDERIDFMARETIDRTMIQFQADSPPAGEMPVVLASGTTGILLHEAMGHGFEADFNRKGTSIFSTMMGRKVAENFVTIVDTGLDRETRGSINVDDEGTPGQRTVLVEDGRLVSYLHDRISANHYRVKPTGNGRRQSFRYAPVPRMRLTTMENGPHDPEEIIRSVKKGLYAVHFSNGQVDIGAGDYSFYLKSGYLIEDGKLTRPVKDANLIGNGPKTLGRITMVGNDTAVGGNAGTCGKAGQWVPVSTGMPTVKVSAITVGGAG